MPSPTNTTLLNAISDLNSSLGRIGERVEATHNLAVKTNGRVTKLEGDLIAMRAVDEYKEKQYMKEAQSSSNPKGMDMQKVTLAFLGVLATALAIISTLVGK